MKEIVRLHGFPRSIILDRDRVFLTSFWAELFCLQGTKLAMSSAYYPQTDGQIEALNKCLEIYLCCFVSDEPKRWVQFLPWAEFWYNIAYHTSAGVTPILVVYGRQPPTVSLFIPTLAADAELATNLLTRDQVLHQLKLNLSRAQNRMKIQADRHCSDHSFEMGDLVFVKLQPFRQLSLRDAACNKLNRRFFGPYRIMSRIGSVAYKLDLPPTARVHLVFHISCLKSCMGDHEVRSAPLPPLIDLSDIRVRPYRLLQARAISRQGQGVLQVLVH